MATKLKTGTARHLALVPPAPTFTPYEIAATDPFWICPPWCPGTPDTCWGGETFVFAPGTPGTTTCRMHEVAVYETQAVDSVDAGWVKVLVRIERADSDDDAAPFPADVVLKFTGENDSDGFGVRLTRAQRRELAAALLNADDLDDTATEPPMAATA